jgi:hypothetical protein
MGEALATGRNLLFPIGAKPLPIDEDKLADVIFL